jgi:hypothetical protein
MNKFAAILATFVTVFWLVTTASALSVDEIIELKQAGVSDGTIELLIKRAGDARSAGVWKQDGWIVYSSESRFPDTPAFDIAPNYYPMTLYPQMHIDRRPRRK